MHVNQIGLRIENPSHQYIFARIKFGVLLVVQLKRIFPVLFAKHKLTAVMRNFSRQCPHILMSLALH